MKEKENNPLAETADQALKNYEQALRTGLKFQEDAWQSWCTMLNQMPFSPDWQKRYSHAFETVNSIVPTVQKRMEETVEVMEKNAKYGTELMKKALDAAQTTALSENQTKWTDFVKTSLVVAQYNVEAVMRLHSRALDSFLTCALKNSEAARATKAA